MAKMKHSTAFVPDLFTEPEAEASDFLTSLLDKSDSLYVKKLSVNDRDWARLSNKRQAGIYVPSTERDGNFFPPLATKERDKAEAAEIRETYFEIEWPTVGQVKRARLVHYTSKGEETHLTGLPKPPFRDAPPASLLVVGKSGGRYKALVVDSESDEYEVVHDVLSLPPDFHSEIFITTVVRREREEKTVSFIEEVVRAFFDGTFPELASRYGAMPTTSELAAAARNRYLGENRLRSLDPYAMCKPGDALRAISRGLEYEIFKDYQIKARSIDLARMILGDDPSKASLERVLRAVVLDFPKIDALLLSAAQQRKSRAGYSFEHHIDAMLADAGVPFEKQVVLEARKRPDFILPSKAMYESSTRQHCEALVLSAKTTLRERWKQVKGEMRDCDLYLATVDESIAVNAIKDMASQGIRLVVPESLKSSDTTEYKAQDSVLSFKDFFENDIAARRKLWIANGIFATGV
ncbi:restriction endonuclease [Pseudomonas sp. SbB1]|uniref:Restriction endonuclease EcoRII n=1 Tax=Pseudomonas putida (strain GB-1) TaxID=76869 RepID=B0KIU3_PSEPG|nr:MULTISPECIES: type II restriction endonuclease [Pseudomonas]ABZ00633.1 Restriction endonuclease EcoRII [Pseudomonas putida GB-1]MBP0710890.1 restriction endonuclease [Pseudomonas sp. T34]MCK2190337.1 type II restriction endonuclease [Pseudomonas sp. MB04B]MDD2087940.1 type II restriction endonuclease [Pseudomonas putida]MDD2097913.1 type II restriction endonuclease [Pseudomonas putida]